MTFLEGALPKLSPPALFKSRHNDAHKKSERKAKPQHLSKPRRKHTPFERIMSAPRPVNPQRHRTLFISDTHLGTPGCKADLLLDFLRHNETETLFLVGDIIDGWRIKRSWFWHESHNAVVQEILHKVRHGTRVIYVPGNHDEALRDFTGLDIAGVDVSDEFIHTTADGRSADPAWRPVRLRGEVCRMARPSGRSGIRPCPCTQQLAAHRPSCIWHALLVFVVLPQATREERCRVYFQFRKGSCPGSARARRRWRCMWSHSSR